jgi:ComF family protein
MGLEFVNLTKWGVPAAKAAGRFGLQAGGKFIDLLLPPLCPVTRLPVDKVGLFHADAWRDLVGIADPQCRRCGVPLPFADEADFSAEIACGECIADAPVFTTARAALVYNDASKALVLAFKHGDQQHLHRHFVPLLHKAGAPFLTADALIIPVPLHGKRLLRRRYNQAGILAVGLGKAAGVEVSLDALQRIKATKPQGHFSAEQREKNVKGAFKVRQIDSVKGRSVVLVDDVMTSGATFSACAKALLAAGAKDVSCLAVARAVKS